ncbi:MAG: flagellar hook-length control protein FliK [Candidatus Margulisiibacteriota bacterium]
MLEISKITSIDTPQNSAASASANDNETTFHQRLEEAEKQIKEKYQNQAWIPWGAVEALFQNLWPDFNDQLKVENVSAAASSRKETADSAGFYAAATSSSTHPQATENASAAASPEKNRQNALDKLSQTVLSVNLAGNPFFLDALWNSAFSKLINSKIDLEQIIAKIVDQARILKIGEKKTLEIALSPDELGKILLTVTKNEGQISIRIFAAEHAKDILEENISALEESLKNANINIGSLTVSIGSRREAENGQAADAESLQAGAGFSLGEATEALASDPVNVKVDAYLVKKLLGWLPKLSIYSEV